MDGEEQLSLTLDNAVVTSTSKRYHLVNCVGDHRLPALVGTREDAGTGRWELA